MITIIDNYTARLKVVVGNAAETFTKRSSVDKLQIPKLVSLLASSPTILQVRPICQRPLNCLSCSPVPNQVPEA